MKTIPGVIVLGLAFAIWGQSAVAQRSDQPAGNEKKVTESGYFDAVARNMSNSERKRSELQKRTRKRTPPVLPENDLGKVLKVERRAEQIVFLIQCKRNGKVYRKKDFDRKHDKINIRLTVYNLEGSPELTETIGKQCLKKGDILKIQFFVSSTNPYDFELTSTLTGFGYWD